MLVAVLVVGAAALMWFAVAADHPVNRDEPAEGLLFGIWDVFYDTEVPPLRILAAAAALVLFAAAGVAWVEHRIASRYRRSLDAGRLPLAPRPVMARTRGVYAGPVTVTVLVPAHNESVSLPATLASLGEQTHPPDRVVVVADNCTDDTVEVARAAGAEVIETVGNTHKKAGALNQALALLLPDRGDNDTVMVMDADTRLDPEFLEAAVRRFTDDRALMAVGGLFRGEEGHGFLGQLQRNEYTRYTRTIERRRGKVFVLTGTASLFRACALRTVAEERGQLLPGRPGDVYDTSALTEDNELTIALKSLGALLVSPQQCTVETELMPTWRALWAQRLRWQRGALENLGAYGITPQTVRYWAQQLGIGYGVIALSAFFLMMGLMILASEDWVWFPFWLGLALVFIAERVVTVWAGGWRARLLGATLLPELLYDLYLDAVYLKGIVDITRGREGQWQHLSHADAVAGEAA